jgi:hypothetical protein
MRKLLMIASFVGFAMPVLGHEFEFLPVAKDCVTDPSGVSPTGSRWVYRVDRDTHRKCFRIEMISPGRAMKRPPNASAHSELSQTGERSPQMTESRRSKLFVEFLMWKQQRSDLESVPESLR